MIDAPTQNNDSAKGCMIMLPAKSGTCPQCSTAHEPWEPHNLCLFYQYSFRGIHGRWPTWKDAMAHCSDDVKRTTIEVLREHGVEVS